MSRIVLLLVSTSLIFLVIIIGGRDVGQNQNHDKLLVVLSGRLELPLSPDNISTIALYQIHKNLWGTLLSSSQTDALADVVHLSDSQETIILRLKNNAKFSNGRFIEAEDVVASISRMMKIQSDGHFNIRSIIKSIEATSPRDIEINLFSATPSFRFLLSIPETGIVPKEIINPDGTLQNPTVTSGPYFAKSITDHSLILQKNEHYLWAANSAQEIELRFYPDPSLVVDKGVADNADFIEAYGSSGVAAMQNAARYDGYDFVSTRPSLVCFLRMNQAQLNGDERVAIADLMDQKLSFGPNNPLEAKAFELLPPHSFAALNLNQSVNRNRSLPQHLPKKIRLKPSSTPLFLAVTKILKAANVSIDFIKQDSPEEPAFEIKCQGMNSDYPEIEFHLMLLSPWATIPPLESEKEILRLAMHEADDKKRFDLLQKLGRSILDDARIVPLVLRSYVHLYKKDRLVAPQRSDYDGDVILKEFTIRR